MVGNINAAGASMTSIKNLMTVESRGNVAYRSKMLGSNFGSDF